MPSPFLSSADSLLMIWFLKTLSGQYEPYCKHLHLFFRSYRSSAEGTLKSSLLSFLVRLQDFSCLCPDQNAESVPILFLKASVFYAYTVVPDTVPIFLTGYLFRFTTYHWQSKSSHIYLPTFYKLLHKQKSRKPIYYLILRTLWNHFYIKLLWTY